MFDTLTYAKGAAVLRMLEQYLQPEAFRQGIHNYLERHALGNAETTDLWEALDAASGQSARKVMESWVFQGGYPLVHVERGPGNDEISLRQTPFAFRDTGTRNTVWEIPVVIGVGFLDGHRERIPVLLGAEPTTVTVPRKATWILVNDGGWGYYRSGYAPDLWKRLLGAWPELTAIERYGLAEDVWATVQAGQTPLVEALRLWRTFRPERDAELWGTVDRHLHLLDVMADDEGRRALATYAREIARPLFDALGWEPAPDETVQTTRLRALLLGLLGGVGQDEEVRCEARRRLLVHHRDETALSPSLLTVVANLVAFTGGKEAWDLLYSRFRNASTPQDEVRYLYALGNVKDPELVHRTLDLYQSSEIRAQDAPIALAITLNNRFARHDAWVVIEDHWDELLAKYQPVAAQYFAATMPSIVETGLADRVAAWFRAHPVPAAAPQIAQALEFQDIHRAMARRIRSDLASILTRL